MASLSKHRLWRYLSPTKFALVAFAVICTTMILLALSPIPEPCVCPPALDSSVTRRHEAAVRDNLNSDNEDWGEHKLCLVVPFRDRFEELLQFVPHMDRFLNQQKLRHKILIINQVDELRFNRASLINVGFLQGRLECDYFAMHDIDLLPCNSNLSYGYPPSTGTFHVSPPHLHPKYHYPTFVGGIMLMRNEVFIKIKGMSNIFWGWGREDDEFYARLQDNDLLIHNPANITTNSKTSFKHNHDGQKRVRDYSRHGEQKQFQKKRDRVTGFDTVQFNVSKVNELHIDGAAVTIVNVELECDFEHTPWCVHPEKLKDAKLKAQGLLPKKKEREVFYLPGGINH